jgi:hypothetical protein
MKSLKARVFLTCWVVFSLHFATEFVREHYLVLSIVDDFSFRLDRYLGFHYDIFDTPDHGAHHGANPGASMIAAPAYLIFKPLVDKITDYTRIKRLNRPTGRSEPRYNDYRPARAKFYRKVMEHGLDMKFGLLGFITAVFCMAPLSSLGAVYMMKALEFSGFSIRLSLWLSFLFAFGTPIFFRTAYLNHNLMVGIFSLIAFVELWKMEKINSAGIRKQFAIAGFFSGLGVLCDYSGLVPLLVLFGYGILCARGATGLKDALKKSIWYIYGAVPPVCVLLFYQWRSFGHPLYPAQHYMPPVEWIEIGYKGAAGPSGELLWMLLFDVRFGLFIVSPILFLGLVSPVLSYVKKNIVPLRETVCCLILFISTAIFLSGIQYTRLQWLTGIRYIVPAIPFLFLLTGSVLVRMPRLIAYGLGIFALAQSWAMSMVRRGVGVPEESMLQSVKSVMEEGLQLPWINTLAKMDIQYLPFLKYEKLLVYVFFVIAAMMVYCIWRFRIPNEKLTQKSASTCS